MRVKILKRSFAGAEFAPDVRVLKVGGQSSAGVEKLEFELPAEWQGLSVTLHVQWLDGTLPAPVLLDDEDSVAVDKTLTASPGGQWMLLALGADGYRALTKPTKYECYSTLNTDGDVEISPTQYETFVARVLEYSNTAQQAAASAKTNAETAATAATRAVNAKGQAETAARTATAGAENSENSAARAEAAAHRAELAAPETGKVVSVNGKGGAVHLTAEDVGAMPASGAAVVQSIRLEGRTLTVTMADGSEKSFTTQDTTSLPAMTEVLGTEHGGTGKETPLTAEDVGAVEAGSGVYLKALTVQGNTMTVTKGDGSTETVMLAQEYVLPAATADALGGVKVGDYLDIAPDGTLSGKTLNDKIAAAVAVKSEPRLVWNHYEETGKRWKTYDIKMPDGLGYVHVKTRYNDSSRAYGEEVDIAKGGTACVPGGFGTGKTMTQHQIAKWSDADVIIYIGCGERGNEMTQVLEEFSELIDPKSGNPLMDRTTLIANTSNMPVAAREASLYAGVTLAEYYRDMGYHVAIMADSTSRWAEALRELSGRLEEMPAEEGFPAYLASRLSSFYERAGMMRNLNGTEGSVTIIGAVSPQGGDFSEPVTQNTKRFVRCFWGLDKNLSYARHFPAIHWLTSYSEYVNDLSSWYIDNVDKNFVSDRNRLMALLTQESSLMEIVKLIGADVLPDDQKLVLEIAKVIRVGFLQQNAFHKDDTSVPLTKQFKMMETILYLYKKSKALIAMGMPMSVLKEDKIFDKIISIKYDVPNDRLDMFDDYKKQIDAFYEHVLERNA